MNGAHSHGTRNANGINGNSDDARNNRINNSNPNSTVKNLTLTLIATLALASVATAQTSQTLNAAAAEIARSGRYGVSVADSEAVITDARTGAEVARLREVSPTQITASAEVTRTVTDDEAACRAIRERVSMYNMSAPVGTLDYDEAAATITIRHYVNPRYASATSIAQVAVLLADAARSEQRVIAALQNGEALDCASNLLCSR
jgi:hypothetical protein